MLSDKAFMQRALELARCGAGLVSPNPMVGAVLVCEGRIVGEGFHRYDLLKHAESYAIEMAGPLSQGATLYCSLEPCCHEGRTPPCTDALIRAGIKRALVAMADPNPRVSGRGIDQLRAAGVEVDLGLLEGEATRLNESYLKYIRKGIPFLHAVVVDGATPLVASQSTEPERRHVDREEAMTWQPSARLREMASEYDAVVLGNLPEANRSIVDASLSRNRHRPFVIAGRREFIREFNRDTSLDGASVNDSHELAEPLMVIRPAASSEAVFVELDLQGADPIGTAFAAAGGVDLSADSRASAAKSGSELDLLLESLGRTGVTSVLVLPGGIGALASASDARIDRLTIVRGQNSSDEAGRDLLLWLDSVLDYSLVHETSEFVEVTGSLRVRSQATLLGQDDLLDQA
jgi:pyrimidine deaminase RibD-like protein